MKTNRGNKPLISKLNSTSKPITPFLLGTFAVLAAAYVIPLWRRRNANSKENWGLEPLSSDPAPLPQMKSEPKDQERKFVPQDQVEEASWESFPASDPPAW